MGSGSADRRYRASALVAALKVVAVVIAAAVSAVGAESAPRPPDFVLSATSAEPGQRVTVRVARASRSLRVLRLYLVRTDVARSVRARLDSRLHFVGLLRLRRTGPSALTFTVPPLESGSYALAYSAGRTFVVGSRGRLSVLAAPASEATCPVTIPTGNRQLGRVPTRHGNGLLWAGLPRDGKAVLDPDRVGPDGSIFWTKQIWAARGIYSGPLEVQIQRLDAPNPVLHPEVISGHLSGWSGPSWAARMWFSSEGCWKVTGRIDDVSLSFVLKVELRRPGA
jgi:hypothetical protein